MSRRPLLFECQQSSIFYDEPLQMWDSLLRANTMPALIGELVFVNVLADSRWIKCCLGLHLSYSDFLEASGGAIYEYVIWESSDSSAEFFLSVCIYVFERVSVVMHVVVRDVRAKPAFNHFMGHVSDTERVKFPLWRNCFTIYCWLMN